MSSTPFPTISGHAAVLSDPSIAHIFILRSSLPRTPSFRCKVAHKDFEAGLQNTAVPSSQFLRRVLRKDAVVEGQVEGRRRDAGEVGKVVRAELDCGAVGRAELAGWPAYKVARVEMDGWSGYIWMRRERGPWGRLRLNGALGLLWIRLLFSSSDDNL
jgi:hypothetical protein